MFDRLLKVVDSICEQQDRFSQNIHSWISNKDEQRISYLQLSSTMGISCHSRLKDVVKRRSPFCHFLEYLGYRVLPVALICYCNSLS